MKRFTFSLEKVLKLRKHHEHEREVELGEITSRCVRAQKEIHRLQEEKRRIFGGRSFTDQGVAGYAAVEAYGQRLDREIQEHRHALAKHEEEREEAQKRFLEASRQRKVLEKLKEKKQERHTQELRREEQQELDEIGAQLRYRQ